MPNTTIYTVLLTGVDVEREFFPDPEALGSYLSRERARKEMWRMAKEEDEIADSRYNGRDDGDDFWMAFREGEASSLFTRVEVLTSQLMDDNVSP